MTDTDEETAPDPYAARKRMSFAEAEGFKQSPPQLKLKEISRELRAKLWQVLFNSIRQSCINRGNRTLLVGEWLGILSFIHVNIEFKMIDEFSAHAEPHLDRIKQLILRGNYIEIFEFLQTVLRKYQMKWILSQQISDALVSSRAAYRVVELDTIVPISSETDFETFQRAIADLSTQEFNGARVHLKAAGAKLSTGEFADSVRESISSVESVARKLAPSNSLSDSLAMLERKFEIHPALKKGFNSIYGYTSAAKGIRHPLVDEDTAKVDEADALFMLVACSAFVTYLIFKTNSK